jgi:hypothetical protein
MDFFLVTLFLMASVPSSVPNSPPLQYRQDISYVMIHADGYKGCEDQAAVLIKKVGPGIESLNPGTKLSYECTVPKPKQDTSAKQAGK